MIAIEDADASRSDDRIFNADDSRCDQQPIIFTFMNLDMAD